MKIFKKRTQLQSHPAIKTMDNAGVTLLEYAFIAGFIGIAAFYGMKSSGDGVDMVFGDLSGNMANIEVAEYNDEATIGSIQYKVQGTKKLDGRVSGTISANANGTTSINFSCNSNEFYKFNPGSNTGTCVSAISAIHSANYVHLSNNLNFYYLYDSNADAPADRTDPRAGMSLPSAPPTITCSNSQVYSYSTGGCINLSQIGNTMSFTNQTNTNSHYDVIAYKNGDSTITTYVYPTS